MPEPFEATLHQGTEQVVDTLSPVPAAELRARGERHARHRRNRSLALCAAGLLAISGTAAGVLGSQQGQPGQTASAGATKNTGGTHLATSPAGTASASASSTAEATGPVGVSIAAPAAYAVETDNRVGLTLTNPGPARQVIVEFDTTGTAIFQWADVCDAGLDGGCTDATYAANALKVAQGAIGETPTDVVRFSLALPHGSSTYNVFVTPPRTASTYTVRVLDEKAQAVFGSAESPRVSTTFPGFTLTSQGSTSVSRGGGFVDFSTTLSNPTVANYVRMGQFGTVSCASGQSSVSISAGDYTLEWYTGANWAQIVNGPAPGQMNYYLTAGESTTTKFRLRLNGSLSSQVTSCQVVLTVSPSNQSSAPYYDTSQPKGQVMVNFTVR